TGTPNGRTDGASTGTTSTLLTPRLFAATRHFRASQLRTSTLTGTCGICNDDLVNQSFVEFAPEGSLGNFKSALGVFHYQFHYYLLRRYAVTAGLTITLPLVAPGTAPLMSSRLRSASTRTSSRFGVVTR